MRNAPSGHPGEEALGLRRRADDVVEPLEKQEGRGHPVDVLDRRAFLVAGGHLVERSDEAVEVLGLEVVGLVGGPAPKVEDGVDDRAAGVHVGGDEGGRGRPAARAAPAHREPGRVGGALGGERRRDGRAVLDVDDAPLLAQPLPVLPAVAGGAPVVDLGDADPARGEVGDLQVEDERCVPGGPAVRPDDVGRQFAGGAGEAGVVRRVDLRVDLPPAGAGEGPDPRLGVVRGVDGVGVRGADHPGAAGAGVQLDELVGAVRSGGDADDPGAVRGEGGGPLGPGARGVGEGAALGIEQSEGGGAPAVDDGDQSVLQGREPAQPDLPERSAELLVAGAEREGFADLAGRADLRPVEVPPAGAVTGEEQSPGRVPADLRDRLGGPAGDGAGAAEGAVGADLGELDLGAVPGHPGVVPGDPGRPAPVRGEPGSGHEPVPSVGEFAYGGAVVGRRSVQRHGGEHPAHVGRRGPGELLQDAPHLAAVRVDHRVHPAQSAADAGDGRERPGSGAGSGLRLVEIQALVGEVAEDHERSAARPRDRRPGLSAVLDDPAADVPRRGEHGLLAAVGAPPDEGPPAALGGAGGGPPQLVADGAHVFGASVVGGGERGVDGRRPAAVGGRGRGHLNSPVTVPRGLRARRRTSCSPADLVCVSSLRVRQRTSCA